MGISLDELRGLLSARESEHLEFKEAKSRYDFEKLVQYCAALCNEGGGKIILGVTDERPRRVVGSHAFDALERTRQALFQRLRIRVMADEVDHPDGRVVVFHVPGRAAGTPVSVDGKYLMRAGDSLVPMLESRLRQIFAEEAGDFSAQICPDATLEDLDTAALEAFRESWGRNSKSARQGVERLAVRQLLRDAELMSDEGVTYAALILFGSKPAVDRLLPQAELIFEYRSAPNALGTQDREGFRAGFFLYHDQLWDRINLRNDVQPFLDGLFRREIPTFNEDVFREAVLNAVCHRDYRDGGSVFVRQFPRSLEVVSPGGFLPGITPENVLWRQKPRNRRLAESFERCGLVERSGQGVNRMYEESIKQGKPVPDFSRTDEHEVLVVMRGEVQDPQFLRVLEQIGQETLSSFDTGDFIVVDCLYRDRPVPIAYRDRLDSLRDRGVVERIGRGRGVRHILSKRFYEALGISGAYTRSRGLDRETNKELLFRHIAEHNQEGSQLSDLVQVLPMLSGNQVQKLLQELKTNGRVHVKGSTRGARWFVGPESRIT